MNDPSVSIIVPVYKVEAYLRRCLDSILSQDFSDYEVILLNDGSPDNSPVICDEYASIDSRFKVIHKPNEGVAKTRLRGYDEASGKYFVFVDSDDYLLPGGLKVLFDEIEKGYDIVRTCVYRQGVNGNNWIEHYPIESGTIIGSEEYLKAMIVDNIAPYLHCAIYRANLFCRETFMPSVEYNINVGEDWIASYLIADKVKKVLFINIPVYVYCVNTSGIMKTSIRGWEYQERTKRALLPYNSQLPESIRLFGQRVSCINKLRYFFIPEISFNWKEYRLIEKQVDDSIHNLKGIKYIAPSYVRFIHLPIIYFLYTRVYYLLFWIIRRKCSSRKILK